MEIKIIPTLKINNPPLERPPLIHHNLQITPQVINIIRHNLQDQNALTTRHLALVLKITRLNPTQKLQQNQTLQPPTLIKAKNLPTAHHRAPN